MAVGGCDVDAEIKHVNALIITGDFYYEKNDLDNAILSYHKALSCFPAEYLTSKHKLQDVREIHASLFSKFAACLSTDLPGKQSPQPTEQSFCEVFSKQTPCRLDPQPTSLPFLGEQSRSLEELPSNEDGSLAPPDTGTADNALTLEFNNMKGSCCICLKKINVVNMNCCAGTLHIDCMENVMSFLQKLCLRCKFFLDEQAKRQHAGDEGFWHRVLKNGVCPICLGETTSVKVDQRCQRYLHKTCLDEYMAHGSNTCPFCEAPFSGTNQEQQNQDNESDGGSEYYTPPSSPTELHEVQHNEDDEDELSDGA